ncbi:MAG TPA: hypothetical protein GXX50_05415 [Firmicutes bacterium]|nr:hypothetical protein [Bacillota bacterium]
MTAALFEGEASVAAGRGYANIEPYGEGVVEGVLYQITKQELLWLHTHEGFPNDYERCLVQVERRDTGETVDAVAYVARRDKVQEGLKPTAGYLAHLLAGADYLSPEYVRRLQNVVILEGARNNQK